MNNKYILFMVMLIFSLDGFTNEEPLSEKVKNYYSVLEQVRQLDSSEKDVENLMLLLHPDFRYEHPRFGANSNYADFEKGLKSVLGVQKNFRVTIVNLIEAKDAAFVHMKSTAQVLRDGSWENSDGPETTLFEFKEGKISRIHEYW